MRYKIGLLPFGRVFTVPCVAEKYLKVADPAFCKALMALLCTDTDTADTAELADKCGITPSQAEDAVIFWNNCGVITAASESGEAVAAVPVAAQTAPEPEPAAQPVVLTEAIDPMKKTASAKAVIRYTPKELALKAKENADIATLYEEIQKIFGRPINNTETAGFVNLYEYYGFSVASILILASFAHELGKNNIAYIETVARDWHSQGIVDYAAVEAEIIRLTEANSFDQKLKKALGIEGTLTKKQQDYFAQWREWGFGIETIDLAGQRCREAKNAFKLGYTNGILKKWHEKQLMTVEAVLSSEEQYAREHIEKAAETAPESKTSSYDLDSWENMAFSFDPSMLNSSED